MKHRVVLALFCILLLSGCNGIKITKPMLRMIVSGSDKISSEPAYALWSVVNWFDAIVLDCLWFCHDRHFVIPGTEDMVKDYHDYWFHIKGALIGMVLGCPAALVAGWVTIL